MVHRIHDGPTRSKRASPWLWLLITPYLFLLWPPLYNAVEPRFLGFPFFYAYQIAAVVVTAILTAVVYFIVD
jgi:hypothetical protein